GGLDGVFFEASGNPDVLSRCGIPAKFGDGFADGGFVNTAVLSGCSIVPAVKVGDALVGGFVNAAVLSGCGKAPATPLESVVAAVTVKLLSKATVSVFPLNGLMTETLRGPTAASGATAMAT